MAPILVLAFAGPLIGSAIVSAEGPAATSAKQEGVLARVVAELRAKDTDKVNIITAGEEQKSSFDQCAAAADPGLCRILVSAVNVATIIGTSFPTK